LTQFPLPGGPRPVKVHFVPAAWSVALLITAYQLDQIIIPLIETKATGFNEHVKSVSRFAYLNGVAIYVVNLVQILVTVFALFIIFSLYDVFGCIGIGYPLLFAALSATAALSFAFLLQATFESSEFQNSTGQYTLSS
jgi:hypothetical protein